MGADTSANQWAMWPMLPQASAQLICEIRLFLDSSISFALLPPGLPDGRCGDCSETTSARKKEEILPLTARILGSLFVSLCSPLFASTDRDRDRDGQRERERERLFRPSGPSRSLSIPRINSSSSSSILIWSFFSYFFPANFLARWEKKKKAAWFLFQFHFLG